MTELQRGIDVSVFQGHVDWKAVKEAGASFAAAKCSEGVGYVDPQWATNWAGMAGASLVRIGYHYARPDLNNAAIAEADWFVRCLGTPQVSDIVVLDIEVDAPSVDVAGWCQNWLRHVELALGCRPLIYTFLDYAQRHFAQTPALARWPLWLALYSQELPHTVPPWHEVSLWQRTASAHWPGVARGVDEDVVARSLEGLKALGKPEAISLPPRAPHPHDVYQWARMTSLQWLRTRPDAGSGRLVELPVGTVLPIIGPPTTHWTNVRTPNGVCGWILSSNAHLSVEKPA